MQSVKTGPVETTGRGIAVIGVTSRIVSFPKARTSKPQADIVKDALLLLEKRVKSRFSHRMLRVTSPLAPGGLGWPTLLRHVLVPWHGEKPSNHYSREERKWRGDWEYAVDVGPSSRPSDTMHMLTRCRRCSITKRLSRHSTGSLA